MTTLSERAHEPTSLASKISTPGSGRELPGCRQIYLLDNPLLREPLTPSTSSPASSATGDQPGLNLVYAHSIG